MIINYTSIEDHWAEIIAKFAWEKIWCEFEEIEYLNWFSAAKIIYQHQAGNWAWDCMKKSKSYEIRISNNVRLNQKDLRKIPWKSDERLTSARRNWKEERKGGKYLTISRFRSSNRSIQYILKVNQAAWTYIGIEESTKVPSLQLFSAYVLKLILNCASDHGDDLYWNGVFRNVVSTTKNR